MTEMYYLTKEGEKKLREELEDLRSSGRTELAQRLREAILMGDLSENADYIGAKKDQGFLEGRIQEIEHILHYAEIIDKSTNGDGSIGFGTTVTLQEDNYPPEQYFLVGRQEADPRNGKISNESPIGKALMGKMEGEKIAVTTPAGEIQFQILKVE